MMVNHSNEAATGWSSPRGTVPSVSIAVQLVVKARAGIDLLTCALAALQVHGVRVLTSRRSYSGGGTRLLLLADSHLRAWSVLQAAGFKCDTESVVLIRAPWRAGFIAQLAQCLYAKGIDLQYSYSASATDQTLVGVLKTTDDERAVQILQRVLDRLAVAGEPLGAAPLNTDVVQPTT